MKSLRQLGHYVEENYKDDMSDFLRSGFQPGPFVPAPVSFREAN